MADRLKIDAQKPVGLDDGCSITISGITFHGVASAHETVEVDEQGRAKFLGYVLKFGDWTLYHSGDTVRYDGMAEKLRPFKIDVALLPINGRAPERRVPGNLFGREAAQLAKDIQAELGNPLPLRNVRIQHRLASRIHPRVPKAAAAIPRVALRGSVEFSGR